MQLISTRDKTTKVSFTEAMLTGMPKDGGLYTPLNIPIINKEKLSSLFSKDFCDIAVDIAELLIGDEFDRDSLIRVVKTSFNFAIPLVEIDKGLHILELYRGPTQAFKDFGARFMANLFKEISTNSKKNFSIITATSGDTGGAVANAFSGLDNVSVYILFPKGRVSSIQEMQLTSNEDNVFALEVEGSFDDCQTLVKMCFADSELKESLSLTSANSINIARLLPQTFYYHYAASKLGVPEKDIVFTVPCGNLGNITAGIIANQMRESCFRFIAATNSNNMFDTYLKQGLSLGLKSIQTISNAMDVAIPSNLERLNLLFNGDRDSMKSMISSCSVSDSATASAMLKLYKRYGYIADPHTAVGYESIEMNKKRYSGDKNFVLLSTASPAKFPEVVNQIMKNQLIANRSFFDSKNGKERKFTIHNSLNSLKEFLYHTRP